MTNTWTQGAVIVTGGGRGIGARIAVRAARSGAPIAILYRSRDAEAAAVVAEIECAGGRAIAIRADIADEAQIVAAFARIDEQLGRIGGLVNNAATTGERARVAEVTRDQLERTWATNITGAFLCCREAIHRMSTAAGGTGGAIVNVSSIAARTGSPGVWVHYAAAKAALETLSLGLAREVAAEGIRVNVVRPGVIATEIHDGQGNDRLRALLAQVPMGRMGEPAEVAEVAAYLLSADASYVTGAVIEAGGGL